MARIRYRVSDGRILEANFGPVGEPQAGEAVLAWPFIPDPELYKVEGRVVVPYSQAELDKMERAAKWAEVRAWRDALLAATDFTQVPDAPMSADAAQWAAYRAALRDVPQAYGAPDADPETVVWPARPSPAIAAVEGIMGSVAIGVK